MRDFDERLFTRHPNEHLLEEHVWFQRLKGATKMKWEVFKGSTFDADKGAVY